MKLKKYNNFIKENAVEVEPRVKPTTAPTTTPGKRRSPFKKDAPSVKPAPKASAEDVAEKFISLTKDNSYIQDMLTKKYSK